MKISPVTKYYKPKYPSKDIFIYNPELFCGFIPKSWKRSKLIVNTLLAFILSGSSGISKLRADETITVSEPVSGEIDQPDIPKIPYPPKQRPKSVIAPIFIHGEGRGATGCVVMSPPVFISEEEAYQIIETEFAINGIVFEESDFQLDNVKLKGEKQFALDRASIRSQLGFEFISVYDYIFKFGIFSNSTVQRYDLIPAAMSLKNKLQKTKNLSIAIFYDPLLKRGDYGYVDNEYEKGYAKDKIRAKELLRSQVTDFIEWAKKERVLPVNQPNDGNK